MLTWISQLFHHRSRRHTPTLNRVEIRRTALINNYQVFRHLVREGDLLIPVLKSNAYGHGLREVCQIFTSVPEIQLVAVDNYPETQQILHYTQLDVLMMGESHIERYQHLNYKRVHVAVYTTQVLTELIRCNKPFRIHLFLNTGLNREGIQEADLKSILGLIRGSKLIVEGVMSHFACDDEDGGEEACQQQISRFKSMYDIILSYGFSPQYRHINNTSGIVSYTDPWFNAHRLGKGLYGYLSQSTARDHPEIAQQLSMVVDVYSTVISVQQIKQGEGVGYGYQWQAPADGQIATIPFGYAEGLTRVMADQWNVRVGNRELPLVGAISMNYSSCRTNNKNNKEDNGVQHGDTVHVISSNPEHHNNRNEMAHINHTITRELLIKLDDKIRRRIV